MAAELLTLTLADWQAEGSRRFGADYLGWNFTCPVCGNVASVGDFQQYKDKGADPNSATCECIGRYAGAKSAGRGVKPCDYAGYGLFRLSPVRVVRDDGEELHCFAFAEVLNVS